MEPIKLGATIINIDIDDFDVLIKDIIYNISNPSIMYTNELRFIVNEDYFKEVRTRKGDGKFAKRVISFNALAKAGMPLLDHYLFLKYQDKDGVELIIDKDLPSFDLNDYNKTIFAFYFIIMTRGKFNFMENEKLPSFLTNYMDINFSPKEMIKMISRNSINKFNHSWVKNLKLNNFSKPVIQRSTKGIAGFRHFSALKFQVPKLLKEVSPEVSNAYSLALEVAKNGPFYENHPLFMPIELANLSLSKNLLNIISLVFDGGQLQRMKKEKYIQEIPEYNENFKQ